MIFLDTSAIYALASRSDANHKTALRLFAAILDSRIALLTHNYVLIEAFALLQHRLGLAAALAFENDVSSFEIEWVSQELHSLALRRWSSRASSISFVDAVSFVVMDRNRIDTAFAFDADFVKAGFALYR